MGWSQDVNCKMLSLVLTTVDKGKADNDLGDSGKGGGGGGGGAILMLHLI